MSIDDWKEKIKEHKNMTKRIDKEDHMYGGLTRDDIKFNKSRFSRSGMPVQLIADIRRLQVLINMSKVDDFAKDLSKRTLEDLSKRTLVGAKKSDQKPSLAKEMELSDKLEEILGKQTFISIFFEESERYRYTSSIKTYAKIKSSENPEALKLVDELDPDRIYKFFKFKPRYKYFDKDGVRKMINSPEVTKAEKRYFLFNLDKVDEEGQIELNYKEMIYNKLVKETSDE